MALKPEMIRYCPNCGHRGKIAPTAVSCCPDAEPIFIPKKIAMQASAGMKCFQNRVHEWMLNCFGEVITYDKSERSHRFFEEAIELVQACGMTKEECLQLIDYTFNRPSGAIAQECGGVMVTLAALSIAQEINMHSEAETELNRIWELIPQIREKNRNKPRNSPLPQVTNG